MIVKEHNKINQQPYVRITSDKENHYVKLKGSLDAPKNEIMIKGTETALEFEEVYVEPIQANAVEPIQENNEIWVKISHYESLRKCIRELEKSL